MSSVLRLVSSSCRNYNRPRDLIRVASDLSGCVGLGGGGSSAAAILGPQIQQYCASRVQAATRQQASTCHQTSQSRTHIIINISSHGQRTLRVRARSVRSAAAPRARPYANGGMQMHEIRGMRLAGSRAISMRPRQADRSHRIDHGRSAVQTGRVARIVVVVEVAERVH